MTDIEIDKALALAIGWKPEQMQNQKNYMLVLRSIDGVDFWHRFSHRDWNVIGPIAERYNCFPIFTRVERLESISRGKYRTQFFNADTPQKAIALAVIGAKK